MGVSVALNNAALHVNPGEEAVLTATVRNTGPVVDQAVVDLVGPAAAWSVIEPPVLNLYPGDSGQVRVYFRPPRSPAAPAGQVPFGVRVASREDPHGSAVEEGTVEVAPFTDLQVMLLPQISKGSRKGRHKLDVANMGNIPIGAEILLADPDDELKFSINRPSFVAPPGVATQTKLVAIPRNKFFRGAQQNRTFQVMVQPDRGEPVAVQGTFEQQPMVARWVVVGLVALVALAVLLAGFWYALLQPAVKSAAREAAAVEASKAAVEASKVAAEKEAGGGGQSTPPGGGGGPGGGASPGAGSSSGPGGPGGSGNLTKPFDLRIQATAAPRASGFNLFTTAAQGAKPIDISDIQLQNPAGDIGVLQLRRGSVVMYEHGLENFRDLDHHFVVPLRFNVGEKFTIALQCRNLGGKQCTPSVTFSGKTEP